MLKGIINAFKVKELRGKILLTVGLLLLYRLGSYVPVPGIPFNELQSQYTAMGQIMGMPAFAVLNMFSGGALSRVSVFSLGIMPYITAQIIFQMMQAVIPSLEQLAKEGEAGQRKITQYTRYLALGLSLLNAIGYLFLFQSETFGGGINFAASGLPVPLMSVLVVGTMLTGSMLIMWFGEIITQRGVGNGMSLIIFCNIMSGIPSAIISEVTGSTNGAIVTAITLAVCIAIIPLIVFVERGQRRIPIQYAKRVVGRRVMGGQTTYLPIKVNTAGVVAIIFASSILYFPAQIAVFFPNVAWINAVANNISQGWMNWVLSVALIVFFSYFYTSMVFNPEDTADNLRKSGGFIPGVRPGAPTAAYIKNVLDKVTLPGAIFVAVLAVVPSIIFTFTNNSLVQTFGGTSILIMVGTALDTLSQLESQLKMYDYEGIFK